MNDSGELQTLQGLHANVSLLSQHRKSGPNCNHCSIFFFLMLSPSCFERLCSGLGGVTVCAEGRPVAGTQHHALARRPVRRLGVLPSVLAPSPRLPPRGSLTHHPSQVCVPIPNSQHSPCQGLFSCQSPQQP